jgi:transketolase
MRKQFVITTESIFKKSKNSFLLLGDIGVFGFRNLLKKFSKRAKNFGILEQATISFAAGLSKMGFIPIIHTIAPFMVNRGFEQIKIDFGYQKLRGKFVSIGSSYDYAALGCTHHCPEDVNLMLNIPNMQVVVPGHSKEFKKIFFKTFNYKNPFYFRLTDKENKEPVNVKFGKVAHLQKGNLLTLILVGPVLNYIDFDLLKSYNINMVYITTLRPLDTINLKKINKNIDKFLIIEPFYSSYLPTKLLEIFERRIIIKNISVPYKFLTNYGSKKDHDIKNGFFMKNIKKKIDKLIKLK